MQYLKDLDIDSFDFHSGAKHVFDSIRLEGKLEELGHHLEEVFDGQTPTEGEINDYVWFNSQEIYEALGII